MVASSPFGRNSAARSNTRLDNTDSTMAAVPFSAPCPAGQLVHFEKAQRKRKPMVDANDRRAACACADNWGSAVRHTLAGLCACACASVTHPSFALTKPPTTAHLVGQIPVSTGGSDLVSAEAIDAQPFQTGLGWLRTGIVDPNIPGEGGGHRRAGVTLRPAL